MKGPLAFDGSCDTHLHFYDGRYPTAPASVLFPPDASPDDYRATQNALGLERLVVVQPTTYGFDNGCQLAGMAEFGDRARGVMVVDSATPEEELRRLTDLGVVGARFHMLNGGVVPWGQLEATALLIAQYGWHVQLQLDGNELGTHVERLLTLPTPLVIDHIGRFMPPPDSTDDPAVHALLRLVDAGRTWVKLSAPYESTSANPPDHPEVLAIVDALVEQAPDRLLWASNWPHPGQPHPLTAEDLETLALRWLPEPETRRLVLVDNPAAVYGFDRPPNPERAHHDRSDRSCSS